MNMPFHWLLWPGALSCPFTCPSVGELWFPDTCSCIFVLPSNFTYALSNLWVFLPFPWITMAWNSMFFPSACVGIASGWYFFAFCGFLYELPPFKWLMWLKEIVIKCNAMLSPFHRHLFSFPAKIHGSLNFCRFNEIMNSRLFFCRLSFLSFLSVFFWLFQKAVWRSLQPLNFLWRLC